MPRGRNWLAMVCRSGLRNQRRGIKLGCWVGRDGILQSAKTVNSLRYLLSVEVVCRFLNTSARNATTSSRRWCTDQKRPNAPPAIARNWNHNSPCLRFRPRVPLPHPCPLRDRAAVAVIPAARERARWAIWTNCSDPLQPPIWFRQTGCSSSCGARRMYAFVFRRDAGA